MRIETDQSGAAASPERRELVEASGAAFVVDLALARVVDANAAGRALWGLGPRAADVSIALDRAMPALRVLSAVAASADAGPARPASPARPVPLSFWRAGGSVQGRFRLSRLSETEVLVAEASEEPSTASPARTAAAPALLVADTPPAAASAEPRRGDLDTLREIARRIRSANPMPCERDAAPPPASAAPAPVRSEPARPSSPREAAGAARPAALLVAADPPPAEPTEAVLARIAADAARLLARGDQNETILTHEMRTHVTAIEAAARTALEHARVKPSQPFVFAEVALEPLVEAAVARAAAGLESRGIRLSVSIGRRMPHVIIDRTALATLLDGMLEAPGRLEPADGTASLAVRHAADGPVVIAVCLRPPAGAVSRIEARLAALRTLAAAIGCALTGETLSTGLLNLRLEIPKGRLNPV